MDAKTKSVRISALREEILKSEKIIHNKGVGTISWWNYSRIASLQARIKEIQETKTTNTYLA